MRLRLFKARKERPTLNLRWGNVFLEDATWNALCEIARERGCTVDELCDDIKLNFAPGEPFEQAARFYVLRHLAERISDNIELPPDLRILKELAGRRPIQ